VSMAVKGSKGGEGSNYNHKASRVERGGGSDSFVFDLVFDFYCRILTFNL
jgi:hypothetical protein